MGGVDPGVQHGDRDARPGVARVPGRWRVDLLDAGRITGIVGTMREMQVGIKFLF